MNISTPVKRQKPWIQKYLPKTTKDIIGQDKAIESLKSFISEYGNGKTKRCSILYGGIGSGKTSSVVAIAEELGYELVEMNSSDFRNKDKIENFIGIAMKQRSLFFPSKIILVDEIDGLSGTRDRGGVQTITKLIKDSAFPIICTANDPYNKKLKSLRTDSLLVEFHTLDYRSIANNLVRILNAEKCEYDDNTIKALARRCGGDMRAAINDMQTATNSGANKLTKESIEIFEENERHQTESLQNALLKIMKTTDVDIARASLDNINEDIDTVMLWLEENIPKEYKGEDLKNALMMLSKADVYKGRIRRWQYWRFLAYIYPLCSAGIALSKKEKYKGFVKYDRPSRILKLWQAKMKYQKRKAIAEKIAAVLHTSSKRVIHDILPYIQVICRRSKIAADKFMVEFDLDKDEIAWISK